MDTFDVWCFPLSVYIWITNKWRIKEAPFVIQVITFIAGSRKQVEDRRCAENSMLKTQNSKLKGWISDYYDLSFLSCLPFYTIATHLSFGVRLSTWKESSSSASARLFYLCTFLIFTLCCLAPLFPLSFSADRRWKEWNVEKEF